MYEEKFTNKIFIFLNENIYLSSGGEQSWRGWNANISWFWHNFLKGLGKGLSCLQTLITSSEVIALYLYPCINKESQLHWYYKSYTAG